MILLAVATALGGSEAALQTPAVSPAQQTPKYLGPGSCSANACHGGVAPRAVTKVLQNEYSTWVTKDRHARAYNELYKSA